MSPAKPLEPGIDRLAFQRQDSEYTLMDSTQRFPLDKSVKCFDTQRKFAQRQRPLRAETSGSEAFEMLLRGVFRSVDDAQVFSAPALNRRLH